MPEKPTYKELEQRIHKLEKAILLNERLEEEIESIFDLSPDLIGYGNLEGYFTNINSSFLKILGHSEKDIHENQFLNFVHEDDIEKTKVALLKARKGTRNIYLENRYQCKDGSYKWIDWHVQSMVQKNKFLAIGRDITERKQIELALLDSEERFRYLSNASSEAIFFTKDGICLEANQATAAMFGYDDPSEFIGMFGTEIIAPESHDIVKEHMIKNLTDPYEAVGKRKDGTQFPIAIQGKILPYKNIKNVRATSIIDITDSKQAMEALQTAEATYRNLFLNSQIGLFRTDINTGFIIDANDAVARFLGYKDRGELFAQPFNIAERYVDNKDREKMLSLLKEHGEFKNVEARYRRNDGSIIWMRFSGKLVPEKGWLEGVSEDITKERLANEALHKSENRYRLIAENVADVIWTMDMNLNFTYISPSIYKLRGYSVEEAMAHSLDQVVTPDSIERMINIFTEKMSLIEFGDEKGFKPANFEVQQLCKDGSAIWASINARILPGHDKQPASILGITRDISEHKKVQAALLESNKKLFQTSSHLSAVIENANVWLNVVDRDGNVVIWNKAAEQISGYSRDEVMSHGKIWEWSYPDAEYREEIFSKARMIIEQGGTLENFETTIRTKSNNSKIISWHSRNLADEKGEPIGSIALGRDVTATKLLEAELVQARKMESVGTMASGIAHDFNNILFMITGNAELAMEDISEWNPVYNNLKEIKSAGLRAAGIVNQLLNFSRKTDQEFKPIRAVTVIKDVIEFLRSTIPTTIEFRKQLPDIETTILGDPTQINQMMINLCINASQAMEATGGILDIAVENITLDETTVERHSDLAPGDYLKITIIDTGPGIEPQTMGRIFDPYFTTKGVGKGSGMGLAVVHGIVKNHNGTITVDSQPGEGATFTILFPVIYEKPEMNVPVSDKIPRGNGEKILYIDDEVSIAKMVEQMLERQGYSVEAQTSPATALELFLSQPDAFDLVITDMTMPQMTGVQLSEKLKEVRPDIPVIICSGHSALIDEEKAKTIGIDGYVMKPLVMRDIAKSIRNVLDRIEG